MATNSAQMVSLESKDELQSPLRDSERLALYAEPQLQEMWNELENASKNIGKTVKKYKEDEKVSGAIKTNWKDSLDKALFVFTEQYNTGDMGNAQRIYNSTFLSQTTACTEKVQESKGDQGEAKSNKRLQLQVDQNKLIPRDLHPQQRDFSDEPLMDEQFRNALQDPLSTKEKNLVPAAPPVTDDSGDASNGRKYVQMTTESLTKKRPEAQPWDAWILREYSRLKEIAMSKGWACYQMGNTCLGGHSLTVGVYLKKRGYLLNLHMHIEMQIELDSSSWPVTKGIRLLLLHPKKRDYCTIEAKGEGSLMVCQPAPDALTHTFKYISKKYFSLRDVEDSGYVRNDTLKFLVELL